jgi:hypothetical protein
MEGQAGKCAKLFQTLANQQMAKSLFENWNGTPSEPF